MYCIKTPKILKILLKGCLWHIPSQKKEIYLTFDDGPEPEITPWVLQTLQQYNAKATFFCIGKNVQAHPTIYQQILSEGHSVGNHTYQHRNGWFTNTDTYLKDIERAGGCIDSKLFRPPYGKLKLLQYLRLSKKYSVVMWDVLSGDFDPTLPAEKSIFYLKKYTVPGSIVVFHDSIKASGTLKEILPELLKYWKIEGYVFKNISIHQ